MQKLLLYIKFVQKTLAIPEMYNELKEIDREIYNNFQQIHQELAQNQTARFFSVKEQQIVSQNAISYQKTKELIKNKMEMLEKIISFEEIILTFKNINNMLLIKDAEILNIQNFKQKLKGLFTKFEILAKLSKEEISAPEYQKFFVVFKKNYDILSYRIENISDLLIDLEIQEEVQIIKNIQNLVIFDPQVCETEIIDFSEFYNDELYQKLCCNGYKKEIIPQYPFEAKIWWHCQLYKKQWKN